MRLFEYIHSKGLVFQDVKPLNIAVGNANENQIFFFDFATSEFYLNSSGEPRKQEKIETFRGTPEYMAYNPLNGYATTRADDLTSFGISLLELNNVDLPWMDKTDDDTDMETAMQIVRDEWDDYGIKVSSLWK